MSLKSVTLSPAQAVWNCGACGVENTVALSSLVLGVSIGSRTDTNLIAFPACTGCAAPSYRARTWDTTPEEYAASPHVAQRKAVNALAKHLKNAGLVNPACAATVSAEVADSPEIAVLPLDGILQPAPPSARE